MSGNPYDEWAVWLSEFFFTEEQADEEVLFAVDEMTLAEVSGLDEREAAESLARAVRLVISENWNVYQVVRRVDSWRRAGSVGAHPALPFLALTVYAAAQMGGHEGFAAHNFYVPLRQALVPDDEGEGEPGDYLSCIRELWDDLARWANDYRGGRFGRLVIRDPGRHYGRGLAWQHALVRSYDLRQLDAFFRRIGLQPGEDVTGAELRRALAAWTAGRGEPWAKRLHRVCCEEELAGYAEALLAREARKWDGRPRDPRTGRLVVRVRLGFASTRQPDVGVYLRWVEGLPQTLSLPLPTSQVVQLERDGNGQWFSPHPLEGISASKAMNEGVSLSADGYRVELRPEDAYAFGYDDELGCWVSVDSMSYGDCHHLIVRADEVSSVIGFLQAECTEKPRVDESASRRLPRGWKLIPKVRMDSRPQQTAVPSALASLIPAGSSPRLQLRGGLPLPVARWTYLYGGAPSVGLTTLTDDPDVWVIELGTGRRERFRAPEGPVRELPLWQLPLCPGEHEISHGGSKTKLQIVPGIVEVAGKGCGKICHHGRDGAVVRGTTVEGAPFRREPVIIAAPAPGDSVILLGPKPGDQLIVSLPSWFEELAGVLSWKWIDAWPDFKPAWSLIRGANGEYVASMLKAIEPEVDDGRGTSWARKIGVASLADWEREEARVLWLRYQEVAGVRR